MLTAADLEGRGQRRRAQGQLSLDSGQAHTSRERGAVVSTRYVELHVSFVPQLTASGEVLASAGDDGNILLWVPAENQTHNNNLEEGPEDKEAWRVKHMCRSMGSEIYDLAWSPDGVFFITGSMDNIARIYNAQTGTAAQCNIPTAF